jgi:hypothetical protein
MMSFLMWLCSAAWGASPGGSVAVGREAVPQLESVSTMGKVVRATLTTERARFEVGALVQASAHNATHYETQLDSGNYEIPGDFMLVGAGPYLADVSAVSWDAVRLGWHASVLVEWFTSPVEPTYYAENIESAYGEGVGLGISSIVPSVGVGPDLGIALTTRRPGPELVFGGDVAYHLSLGSTWSVYVGMRGLAR